MTTTKRLLLVCAVATAVLFCAAAPASATPQTVRTSFTSTYAGQEATNLFQVFALPKFPANPSANSQFDQHVQLYSFDASNHYNFVYFHAQKVCVLVVGHPCALKYKIEVTYQIQSSSGLHDGFLVDYGYPGDQISWWYDDLGGNSADAEIFDDGSSGHGSWNHYGTWTWTGLLPDTYQEPHFIFVVDPFGVGHNCVGDMPAQDTPGSPSHVSTLDYLGVVSFADGSTIDLPLRAVSPPVTTVSPTSCAISISSWWDGYDTEYTMTSYGGG